MIISKTPYRISFFGGGTDYPGWYREHGGAVLAAAIDKYCFITVRHLPPFFEHRTRVVYSKVEDCRSNSDISHPAVRAILKHLEIDAGVEIHCVADLPARSGIGSSSTFCVGLLNALHGLTGRKPSRLDLALEAIHIEQDVLKETVGSQDQVMAACGGLRHVTFHRDGRITTDPVKLSADRIKELNSHLMLFYTGIARTASDVAQTYVAEIRAKNRQLEAMTVMVDHCRKLLVGNDDLAHVGALLDEAWKLKRSLSPSVSNGTIDDIYGSALRAGAIGGKILGAGGGGFILFVVPPARQLAVRAALSPLVHVPFAFDPEGSNIIFNHNDLHHKYTQLPFAEPRRSAA